MEKSPLEQILEQPEENVETFASAISDLIQTDSPAEDDMKKITSGKPDQISHPKLTLQKQGVIQMEHGWSDTDYVWHISSHPKRPFKVSEFRLLYAIAQVMNPIIPPDCEVRIWRPYADWDIKEYTFKALGLSTFWQFQESQIPPMNEELFEVLNSLT